MELFERIKKISKQRGWNVKTTAKKAGIGENSIYRWKTQSPTSESLNKVAKVLGVSTDYLLGNNSDTKESVDLEDDSKLFFYQGKPVSDKDKKRMLEIFRMMEGKDEG